MEQLKILRKSHNKTLNDVAKDLNTSPQVISRYELGRAEPDFSTLFKLADYFGVSIDYLLGHDTQSQNIGHTNSLIANEFFHKNSVLLNDKNFVDLAKLYDAMTLDYKTRILTYALGIAIGLGLDTNKLLNT